MFFHSRFIRIPWKYTRTMLLILWIAFGLSACGSFFVPKFTVTPTVTLTPALPTATPVPMALTVNGEGIPIEDFNAEVQRYLTSQTALGKTVAAGDAANTV